MDKHEGVDALHASLTELISLIPDDTDGTVYRNITLSAIAIMQAFSRGSVTATDTIAILEGLKQAAIDNEYLRNC
jgi:hypothetical protein